MKQKRLSGKSPVKPMSQRFDGVPKHLRDYMLELEASIDERRPPDNGKLSPAARSA